MNGRRRFLVPLAFGALFLTTLVGGCAVSPQATPTPTPVGRIDAGMDVGVSLSKAANGAYFAPGERVEVAVTLKDRSGSLTKNDFATLSLYAYGPQETNKTVTAVKLRVTSPVELPSGA